MAAAAPAAAAPAGAGRAGAELRPAFERSKPLVHVVVQVALGLARGLAGVLQDLHVAALFAQLCLERIEAARQIHQALVADDALDVAEPRVDVVEAHLQRIVRRVGGAALTSSARWRS